jgi:tRNA nucleotidyltransferase (CCA-adding enzyme)
MMHLSVQEFEFINVRLHFMSDLLKLMHSAALLETNLPALIGLKPSEIVELLEGYSIKVVEVFSIALQDKQQKNSLNRYLSEWWGRKPKITGHDLKKLGIPPGPRYNEILRRLRAAWLDGEVKTEEEEKKLLNSLLE